MLTIREDEPPILNTPSENPCHVTNNVTNIAAAVLPGG
jgi:hypothetical protein